MSAPLLSLRNVRAGYGAVEVLHGVSLDVLPGQVVTIVGVNGAGKTTLLRAISGIVKPLGGEIRFAGESLVGLGIEKIAGLGVIQVPEGRQLFGPLTVEENLELGGYTRRRRQKSSKAERMERVFSLFPRLAERRRQLAATLSGGEQQMLAIGRALMAEPQVLLLDEPSMGLAPMVVREIFQTLRDLNEQGLTIVLVEQDAKIALAVAHRGFVMERGLIVREDDAKALLASDIQSIYFGRSGRKRTRKEVGS